MESLIGTKLDGRYELQQLVGAGGMANVFKTEDHLEHRTVAVKVLREEFSQNQDLVRRFKNESKAISILNHPGIVKVFDVNMTGKVPYIVMEYVDGITLREYLDRRPLLPWKEALFFVTQVLSALSQAHSSGIVHRDIKPQNIMLLQDGALKIMDFGIARFARSENRTAIDTDKAIGSVHYISPEQAKSDVTDSRSDIYSVGVMLYEMLTGQKPFDADTPVGVALKQISEQPPAPRDLHAEIPEGLETITLKAMEKDPMHRYQTSEAMLEDIEQFKKDPSIDFSYKYLGAAAPVVATVADDTTRVINTGEIEEEMPAKKPAPVKKQAAEKAPAGKRKWRVKVLPLLVAITSVIAIGSLILIYLIFKNSGNPMLRNDPLVELPTFIGMTKTQIQEKIKDGSYKFAIEFNEVFDENQPAGTITDQLPRPPKTVRATQKVTLRVSKGAQVVTIPNLTGKTRADAEEALSKLGLSVSVVVDSKDTSVGNNQVIRTDPPAGTQLTTDKVVTMYVAVGSVQVQSITVPNVVGQTSTLEAKRVLEDKGLKAGNVSTREDGSKPEGTILEQSPGAGKKVPYGTSVDLVVAVAPPPPPPPPPPPSSVAPPPPSSVTPPPASTVTPPPASTVTPPPASTAVPPTPTPTPNPGGNTPPGQ